MRAPFKGKLSYPLRAVVAVILGGIIFIVDTVTNLEIAVAALYTAIILLSVPMANKRGLLCIAAACVVLTLSSSILTTGETTSAGLINTTISILAIVSTTYLVLRIQAAENAAQETRAQLAQVSRVTTLGELTASIAHEVNQPVAATIMYGNACLRWLSADPPNLDEARNALERIVGDATRAGDIIGRIREMAKRKPAEREPVSLNDIVQEIVTLIGGELRRHQIALQMDLVRNDDAVVVADRVQLSQVVLNLLMNAIEAMEALPSNARRLTIRSMRSVGGDITVEISDSGHGASAEQMARMFDAFYTTKANGMGLGLAIARSIITSFGGRIAVGANAPQGATFRFTLPPASLG